VRTLDAGGSVYALDWSPDGTRLAAAVSTYELFRIWSMTTGQLLAVGTLGGQGGVDVRWRPNSNELAVTGIGNEAAAFDATSGNLLRALPTGGRLDFSPDGSQFAAVSFSEENIYIRDTNTGQVVRFIENPFLHNDVDWNPDGRLLVTSDVGDTVKIWDATTGQQVASYNIANVTRVRWSPTLHRVALVIYDGSVQILDVARGQIVQTFITAPFLVAADWSPDGLQVVYGGEVLPGQPPIQIQSVIPAVPTPTLTASLTLTPTQTLTFISRPPRSLLWCQSICR